MIIEHPYQPNEPISFDAGVRHLEEVDADMVPSTQAAQSNLFGTQPEQAQTLDAG